MLRPHATHRSVKIGTAGETWLPAPAGWYCAVATAFGDDPDYVQARIYPVGAWLICPGGHWTGHAVPAIGVDGRLVPVTVAPGDLTEHVEVGRATGGESARLLVLGQLERLARGTLIERRIKAAATAGGAR